MEHRVTTIVRSGNCRIDRCSCGSVHITVGGTTVRVPDGVARELRGAMVQAIAEIDKSSVVAPTPAIHLVDDEEPGGPNIH